MHDVTITVYLYSELSAAAKSKARDWWLGALEAADYAEGVIEDAAQIAELLGVRFSQKHGHTSVHWSMFSQGSGAAFEGCYRAHADAFLKVKDYAPVDDMLGGIAQALDEAFAISGERTKCTITTRGNYSHSGTMQFEFDSDCEENTGEYDVAAVEALVEAALRSFADWIYRQLEQEYEYQTSEENLAELFEANEYTFTAAGKRFG